MADTLQNIRDLQFTDKSGAEALLLSFFRDELDLDVIATELTPKPTSLNSFNGFVHLGDGQRKFFKTHTESNTVITEYYNAGMLANAGYPIIQPTFQSTKTGKQILLYDVIEDQSVFDLAWDIENGLVDNWDALRTAQNRADHELFTIYQQTLVTQSVEDSQKAPIHQLFYHRLVAGRFTQFYSGDMVLPNGKFSFAELKTKEWVINGQRYRETLANIIQRAINVLNPDLADVGVIGHGDAHNGNVFYRPQDEGSLLYFDPAFAGCHHPLLDLVKPLFHNVFAMWMYFPEEKRQNTTISCAITGNIVTVTYRYDLHPVRKMFFDSKVTRTLLPILKVLKQQNQLSTDWRQFLKLALFCCPLLTMNLSDVQKFSPKISLLGLVMSIEMGSESYDERSFIDLTLDEIEAQLKET